MNANGKLIVKNLVEKLSEYGVMVVSGLAYGIDICAHEIALQQKLPTNDIDVVKQIISTMSYSYVKKNGFPILGEYQHAYHIVREADLLSAYDFDRCMTYKLHLNGGDIDDAFEDSLDLFNHRVLQHNRDNLFLTDYSLLKSRELHLQSLQRIQSWKQILKKPHL